MSPHSQASREFMLPLPSFQIPLPSLLLFLPSFLLPPPSLLLVLFVLCSFPSCSTTPEEEDPGYTLGGMVTRLLPPSKAIPGPLALGDFLLNGQPCDLCQEVTAALPGLIQSLRPRLDVISHENLLAVLETQNLQMEDLFVESGVRPGRLMPARTLLVGFFFHRENGTALHAQILDLEKGHTLSAAQAFFPGKQAAGLDPYGELPLEVEFQVMARKRGMSGEFILREGDRLHSKDMVSLRLKPNRPAYCYAFLLNAQGEARLLYPTHPGSPARVEAGELILPSWRTYYELDNHPGEESLLVAASLSPLPGLEALLGNLDQEAARAADVVKALLGMGNRGFVDTSGLADPGDNMAKIMRSYSGMVWRKFDFQHLP